MTESNAYLAYGITVTTESLLYAVAAWPRLQGPFAFLDLVAKRQSKGTLQATNARGAPHSAIELVPIELWHVVRHKLVDLELEKAEAEHVQSLSCPGCREAGFTRWDTIAQACDDGDWREYDGLCNPVREQVRLTFLSPFFSCRRIS